MTELNIGMFSKLSATYKGILLSLLGYSLFSIVDTIGKWLAGYYEIYEIIAFQNSAAVLLVLLLSSKLGGLQSLKPNRNLKYHILRGAIGTLLAFSSVYVFYNLPMTTVYTAIFTQPFFAVILAVLIYKEGVCWRRWIAIAVGFSGVLLAFRPWEATIAPPLMGVLLILPLLVALLYVIMRSMDKPSLLAIAFYPTLVGALATMPFVLMDFPAVQPLHILGFAGLAVLATSAFLCLSTAYKIADASAAAPMHYVQMIWGLVYGYFIFGDLPDFWMMAGAAVIIASGIFLVVQERRFAQ